MVRKMTIGGKRVKCNFCGKTAKVVTRYGHPVCGHCFKAFALGLLIGRVIGGDEVWDKFVKNKGE